MANAVLREVKKAFHGCSVVCASMALGLICASAFGADTVFSNVGAEEMMTLKADTTVNVPAGETNHVELLLGGGYTLTKTGAGRLEIGLVTNRNVKIVVSEGTLEFSRPRTLTLPETSFHLDASVASTRVELSENGTNFVTRINDADGGSVYVSTKADCPNPYLARGRAGGLDMIDFGTMKNMYPDANMEEQYKQILASGYGAAYSLSQKMSGVYEYLFVAEDREEIADLIVGSSKAAPGPSALGDARNQGGRGLGCNGAVPFFCCTQLSSGLYTFYYVNDSASAMNPRNDRPASGINVVSHYKSDKTKEFATVGCCESYGGLRIGEMYLFKRLLAEDERALLRAALNRKWRGLDFASVNVAAGARLCINGHRVTAKELIVEDGAFVEGDGRLTVPGNQTLKLLTPYAAADGAVIDAGLMEVSPAYPGFAFDGAGSLVAREDTKIDYVSAEGTLVKDGIGALKTLAIGSGVKKIWVAAGTLDVSPLENGVMSIRFDPDDAQSLTKETRGDVDYVIRMDDVSGNGRYATNLGFDLPVGTPRKTPDPFIADETANGHTLIDFGSFAATANPEGYGAAMGLDQGVSGVGSAYWVFKDHPEVSTYAIPETSYDASSYLGPTPIGCSNANNCFMRGGGGAGNTHQLVYSNVHSAFAHKSTYEMNGAGCYFNTRVPAGVNVIACRRPEDSNSVLYYGISHLGLMPDTTTPS